MSYLKETEVDVFERDIHQNHRNTRKDGDRKSRTMEAAQAKVEEEYYNSEHILDSENFTGVDFSAEAEREIVQEQKEQLDVLLVKPGMYPQAVQIGSELEDLQKAVGGV